MTLLGHEIAEADFKSGFERGRLHHGWLLTGPKGVGKASLAKRLAAFLQTPQNQTAQSLLLSGDSQEILKIDPAHLQKIDNCSHPSVKLLTRCPDPKTGKMRKEIVVSQIRELHGFFSQTAEKDVWRVAVIDSADDLNISAANALLKLLEEPPRQSILFLVSHNPGRLLPTIKSRCRTFALQPLNADQLSEVLEKCGLKLSQQDKSLIVTLSDGSPGRALQFVEAGGIALYQDVAQLMATLGRLDMAGLHTLAGRLSGVKAEAEYRLFTEIIIRIIGDAIRAIASRTVIESPLKPLINHMTQNARLDPWLELWEKVSEMTARADAVNLDRRHVIINMINQLNHLVLSAKG